MAQKDYPDNAFNITGAEDSMLEARSDVSLPAPTITFIGGISSTLAGLDLAATSIGLHVVYFDAADESITAETTTDYGLTAAWTATIAAAGNADDPVAPSLAVARNDDIYVAWHNAAGTIKIQKSGDFGRTWGAALSTSPTLTGKHARLLITADRQYVAFWHTGDSLIKLYGSTDFYANLTLLETFSPTEQAVSFREDRRGVLHLAYEDSGNVVEHLSRDGLTWTSAATLVSGRELPAAGYATAAGAVFGWENAIMLQVYRTDGAMDSIDAGPVDVTDAYPIQVPGVCVDRRGIVWLALFPAVGGFSITTDLGRLAPDSPQFAIDDVVWGMGGGW